MSDSTYLKRYSVITEKNPREIVLLRGTGCKWRRCKFCDYHLDFSLDTKSNYELNKKILSNVTGKFKILEVINSGSFSDLDEYTFTLIKELCVDKEIIDVYFECHWADRYNIAHLKEEFKILGITAQTKGGVETFDKDYRESIFFKGIESDSPAELAKYYDQVCLLFGVKGQTEASMGNDLEIALKYFNRVCINIMIENGTEVKPDTEVIELFKKKIYPYCIHNPRVDVLLSNTDFGVGEKSSDTHSIKERNPKNE